MIPDSLWLKINVFFCVRVRLKGPWDTSLCLALLSHIFTQSGWMLWILSWAPKLLLCFRKGDQAPNISSLMVVELPISPRTPTISSRHLSLDNLPEETSVAEVTVLSTATAFLSNHFKGEFSQNSLIYPQHETLPLHFLQPSTIFQSTSFPHKEKAALFSPMQWHWPSGEMLYLQYILFSSVTYTTST